MYYHHDVGADTMCCYEKLFISCLSPWRGWSLLKEGGVRLPLLALRARSYKTKAEAWHQGSAPSSSRGLFWFLSVHTTTGYVSREPSFFTTTVTTITTFFCCRGNPVVCVVCHFVTSIRCARSSCCFCCLCCLKKKHPASQSPTVKKHPGAISSVNTTLTKRKTTAGSPHLQATPHSVSRTTSVTRCFFARTPCHTTHETHTATSHWYYFDISWHYFYSLQHNEGRGDGFRTNFSAFL